MKFQDLLLPITLGLLTTWGIQYFIINRYKNDVKDDQTFTAPIAVQEVRPLKLEVDFLDEEIIIEEKKTVVEMPWGMLTFSSHGAILEEATIKKPEQESKQFQTIMHPRERESGMFLVALDHKTPYYYALKELTHSDSGTRLVYTVQAPDGDIEKSFFVHRDRHIIDVTVRINNRSNQTTSARILIINPLLQDEESDVISSVVISKNNDFEKRVRKDVKEQSGWIKPQIFGADDKYFMHVLVSDKNQSIDRAYYKFVGQHDLIAILESTDIKNDGELNVSFYCGPKELQSLHAVDNRLEKSLDYSGIMAPISKILLRVLKWLFEYCKNYGIAIIALTVLVKLVLLPFSIKTDPANRENIDIQKKLTYIRSRYKDDPETMQREQSELLKKHGMAGLGGCLPMLIQIPFIMGLSRLLSGSLELYKESMWWIPDLANKDPYYIIPLAVTIGMLFQMAFGPQNLDARQRMTSIGMACFFGAITANLSSGLAISIAIGSLFSIIQTKIIRLIKKVYR